ncbi:E2F/DP family winged-helix DNA-binding domain-containing protein [Chlamydoabsidia padenii]|nr:E2F/DP family winged-helix DNA-binding domain-containing protein [Chlamydoabsidia padenii]
MCEWFESSSPYFHTAPISITRSHEHAYPTPRSSPRKGSIASLLNSAGELQKLDQEEWSTNYQTHFTDHHARTPMMMVDDEDDDDDDDDDIMSSSTAGLGTPTPYHQAKKGLRLFSQHVCDILQQHGRATYNQLVQQLIEELKPSSTKKTCDPKNIRRRVYDALNVLMAIQFITKDKKEIRWIGGCQQQQQSSMLDQEDISFYHQYMNHACEEMSAEENSDDDDDETMMDVEEDIQREEQRYQDLLQRIELKRKEIHYQIHQKYGSTCQHGLPDPFSFAT